jgi:phosphoribosylglycinamide formyltransferase 2
MNRKAIRDLASKELGLKQPTTAMQLLQPNCDKESKPGMPCVVKPLMSSSGKGQSTIKTDADIEKAWQYAVEGSRGDVVEVIVEAFVKFTGDHFINCCPKQQSYFCAPIGHRQEREIIKKAGSLQQF